jgi:hypothetical protein
MGTGLGALGVVVAALFAHAGGSTHLVARMQPLRVFQVVYLAMTLALGAWLGESLLRRNALRWVVAAAVLAGPIAAAGRATYAQSRPVEWPWGSERNAWVRAFVWIRQNTPRDALFALDADYINQPGEDAQGFRAIAERSALADRSKDGGEVSIAPDLTAEWTREQAAQQRLNQETDAERVRALSPLGVSWAVLDSGAKTGFDCPYANEAVKVCQLP